MVTTPFRHYPESITIATSSFKYAKLAGGIKGSWVYGNPEELVNSAVTCTFTPSKRWDEPAAPKTRQR